MTRKMSKQDALDAINSTIIKNNKKGITADSLRNVLTEMVEASGEGGGGFLTVKLPDPLLWFAYFVLLGEFSPTTIEEALASEEPSEIDNEFRKIWLGYLEHNKQIFQAIMANAQEFKPTALMLDCSESYKFTFNAFSEASGSEDKIYNASISTLAFALGGEAFEAELGDIKDVVFFEIASGDKRLFTDEAMFTEGTGTEIYMYLTEDGSVKFEMTGAEDADTLGYRDFYIPMEGAILTDQQKEDNISTAKRLKNTKFNTYGLKIAKVSADGSVTYNTTGGFGFSYMWGDTCSFLVCIEGKIKNVQIKELTGEVSLYDVIE